MRRQPARHRKASRVRKGGNDFAFTVKEGSSMGSREAVRTGGGLSAEKWRTDSDSGSTCDCDSALSSMRRVCDRALSSIRCERLHIPPVRLDTCSEQARLHALALGLVRPPVYTHGYPRLLQTRFHALAAGRRALPWCSAFASLAAPATPACWSGTHLCPVSVTWSEPWTRLLVPSAMTHPVSSLIRDCGLGC